MTWKDVLRHTDQQLDDYALKMLRDRVTERIELFNQGSAAAIGQLDSWFTRILIARGAAFVRQELEPIKHVVAPSVAAYMQDLAGDYTLSSALLEYANVTNIFEISGLEVPPLVLESFRPLILRVETHRHDMTPDHWMKGLLCLALGVRQGWAPIAGFAPTAEVPFVPRATFGPNVQGLIAHLGGAVLVGAGLDDVMPAWRSFMEVALWLAQARQVDNQVILWAARVVFHHIGKQSLSVVGDRVHAEIKRLVANGA